MANRVMEVIGVLKHEPGEDYAVVKEDGSEFSIHEHLDGMLGSVVTITFRQGLRGDDARGIDFTVEWLDIEGAVIATDEIKKPSFDKAMGWAVAQFSRRLGHAVDAHGMFVVETAHRDED